MLLILAMISGGGRPAGIDVAYKYSFADSINIGDLTWQYPIGDYFPNFFSLVSSISEEIYTQQAVYLSYT